MSRRARRVIGLSLGVFLGLQLAGCNSSTTLTPTETKTTHPLVGSKLDDLRVVSSLSTPDHVISGNEQVIYKNDLIRIKFFGVEKLDRSVRVEPDGMISMPLVGFVRAAGRSIPELERVLEQKYGRDYLQSPDISVYVRQSNGQKIVVDGPVRRPGVFPASNQSTLLRLIAEAGGLTDIADEEKVFVYRKQRQENQVAQYSVTAIRQGKAPDPRLYAGDVIVAFRSDSKIALRNLKDALGIASSAVRLVSPL